MSYLSIAKQFVKKTRWGSYFVRFLPKTFLYTHSYKEVQTLLNLEEYGKNDEVEAILREKMVEVLRTSLLYVPWYRKNVNILPNSITNDNVYEKLKEFPFTSKQLVMNHWNEFINERYSKSFLKIGSTEGTTGQGMLIANSRREIGAQSAFFELWVKNATGIDFLRNRIVRIGLEALKEIDEYPISYCGNRMLVSPIHLVPSWFKEIYEKCIQFGPEMIHSYPTLLFLFAKYIVENDLPPIKIKALLLASDVFMFSHFSYFVRAFGNPTIFGNYNMSEHVAFGKAVVDDNNHSIGYQLEKSYAYNENRVNEFDKYEIVGTSYWNTVMPLIRFCTQDFGKINGDGFIKNLDGRGQSYLTTKQGNKIAGISILEVEDFVWQYIDSFQYVQREPGKIEIRIIPRNNYSSEIGVTFINSIEKKWPGLFEYEIKIVNQLQRGKSTKINSIIVQ